jgi:hypothetical protein
LARAKKKSFTPRVVWYTLSAMLTPKSIERGVAGADGQGRFSGEFGVIGFLHPVGHAQIQDGKPAIGQVGADEAPILAAGVVAGQGYFHKTPVTAS